MEPEFAGWLFDDLLSAKASIRIGDAASESPLVLEKLCGVGGNEK